MNIAVVVYKHVKCSTLLLQIAVFFITATGICYRGNNKKGKERRKQLNNSQEDNKVKKKKKDREPISLTSSGRQ